MFVTYNEFTGQVFMVSETLEPQVPENHVTVEIELTFAELPAHPSFCRFVDGVLEHAPEIEASYALSYADMRTGAYPSIGDQLDALFHAGVFPAEMATRIQAVKDQYPKGQA